MGKVVKRYGVFEMVVSEKRNTWETRTGRKRQKWAMSGEKIWDVLFLAYSVD